MFVGLRDLWFAKGRFILMTTVVAMVALLVVMLSGLTAGLAGENTSAIKALNADFIAFQDTGEPPSYTQSRIDMAAAANVADQPGVTDTAPLGIGRGDLSSGGSSTPVVLFAADPVGFLAPGQLTESGTVVVGREVADRSGITDGAVVTLGSESYTALISPDDTSFAHSPVVWVTLQDWQKTMGDPTATSVLAFKVDSAFDPSVSVTGLVVEPLEGTFGAIGSFTAENGSLQMIRGFLLVISALVIGAFFTVWTIQRRHDIAVLKAMGASTPYLLRDALGQAAIVLSTAAVAGGTIGFVAGALVSNSVPFVSDLTTTVLPLALMVIIGLIGAGLAVRSITNVDPLAALGGSQ